jgi:response regulator RpfG family c-di-GMP phosphodiesterase
VVLDYRMPKKDGLETAKEILALDPSQRIIFASAYVEETLRDSITELSQIVELIQKPFLPEALVEVVEDAEAYPELNKLFGKVRKMTESDLENPSPAQIRDILEGLKKIQKEGHFSLSESVCELLLCSHAYCYHKLFFALASLYSVNTSVITRTIL